MRFSVLALVGVASGLAMADSFPDQTQAPQENTTVPTTTQGGLDSGLPSIPQETLSSQPVSPSLPEQSQETPLTDDQLLQPTNSTAPLTTFSTSTLTDCTSTSDVAPPGAATPDVPTPTGPAPELTPPSVPAPELTPPAAPVDDVPPAAPVADDAPPAVSAPEVAPHEAVPYPADNTTWVPSIEPSVLPVEAPAPTPTSAPGPFPAPSANATGPYPSVRPQPPTTPPVTIPISGAAKNVAIQAGVVVAAAVVGYLMLL